MNGPLVDVAWLSRRLDHPAVVVADCRWWLDEPARARREFDAGHLPGAVFLSLDDDLSAPEGPGRHPLPTPAAFVTTLGAKGIGPDDMVVAYDDRGGAMAARAWWMITALGGAAAVLDGGIGAWLDEGLPLETATPARPPAVWPAPPPAFPSTVTMEDLLDAGAGRILVDARAAERYRGDLEPIDPVAGHIPGAVSLPHEGNLDDRLRFRPGARLRHRFAAAGITDAGGVVVYCGSGVSACHDLLAMELAGLGRGTLYPGSWSDWCRQGGPAETHTARDASILRRDEA